MFEDNLEKNNSEYIHIKKRKEEEKEVALITNSHSYTSLLFHIL